MRGERRIRRWDSFKSRVKGSGRGKGESTIIFIMEFLESMSIKGLYNLFKEFGEIYEVGIPPRRYKRGIKFGFVMFMGVSDIRILVV